MVMRGRRYQRRRGRGRPSVIYVKPAPDPSSRLSYYTPRLMRGTGPNREKFGDSYAIATPQQLQNRRDFGYKGRGLYMGKGRGGYWGQKFGSLFGMGQKGGIFDRLGDTVAGFIPGGNEIAAGTEALHRAIGSGAYAANELVDDGRGSAFSVPEFASSEDGTAIKVSYKEYIQDLYAPTSSSVSFSNLSISINPGIEQCFPWLSQLAMNYDEYELEQLMFTFKSTTTDIGSSTTGQCGTVVMACQYDVTDQPFTDKNSMLRYAFAQSSKTTQHLIFGVECDPAKRSGTVGKYTRFGPLLPGVDLKTYDWGTMNIAMCNIPTGYANFSLGELWVSYTVKLRKPKIVAFKGWNLTRDMYAYYLAAGQNVSYGPMMNSTPAILPAMLSGQANNMGTALSLGSHAAGSTSSQGLLITFPAQYAGAVRCIIRVEGDGNFIPNGRPTLYYNGNCAAINDILTSNATPTPSYTNLAATYTSAGTYAVWQSVVEIHVRLSIATGGVNNSFEYVANWQTGSGTAKIYMQQIELEEYNCSGNTKQDGTADQPIWINSAGTVVTVF